jgi:hypothetical protein
LRLGRSGAGSWPRRRSRLAFRRFDAWGWRRLGPRRLDRLRRRWRRRKLDGRGRRRRRRRRRLLHDRRRWRLRRRKGRLLHHWRRRRRLLGDRRRRGLFGDRRGDGGRRRRLGRSRSGLLSWRGRGLFSRLRLFGWRRGRSFWGRRLLLDVDDHLSRQFDRLRRRIDNRERGGVKRDHESDDERTEPRRADGRRLEDPPV